MNEEGRAISALDHLHRTVSSGRIRYLDWVSATSWSRGIFLAVSWHKSAELGTPLFHLSTSVSFLCCISLLIPNTVKLKAVRTTATLDLSSEILRVLWLFLIMWFPHTAGPEQWPILQVWLMYRVITRIFDHWLNWSNRKCRSELKLWSEEARSGGGSSSLLLWLAFLNKVGLNKTQTLVPPCACANSHVLRSFIHTSSIITDFIGSTFFTPDFLLCAPLFVPC